MGQGWVHPSARWVLGVEQRGGRGLRAQAGTGLLPLARWAAVASQARPSRGGPPSGGLADSPLFPISCWTWRHPGQRNAEAWDARHTDSLSLPPLPVGRGSVPSTLRLGSSLLPVACGGSHVAEAAVLGGPARPACRPALSRSPWPALGRTAKSQCFQALTPLQTSFGLYWLHPDGKVIFSEEAAVPRLSRVWAESHPTPESSSGTQTHAHMPRPCASVRVHAGLCVCRGVSWR